MIKIHFAYAELCFAFEYVVIVVVVTAFQHDASTMTKFLLLGFRDSFVVDEIRNDYILHRDIDHMICSAVQCGEAIFPIVHEEPIEGFACIQSFFFVFDEFNA